MAELRYTRDGVPIYDGTAELYVGYRRAALNYVETLEWKKRTLAGPRLQAALEGSARTAVQHKVPGWISHEKGAHELLDFLKSRVQPPTLAEAGRSISRFFYSVKRRKGEGMSSWIVRHDEALYEARRTLAEAIQEYGPGYSDDSVRTGALQRPLASRLTRDRLDAASERRSAGPFDESGRMRDETEDEQDDDPQHGDGVPSQDWTSGWWQHPEESHSWYTGWWNQYDDWRSHSDWQEWRAWPTPTSTSTPHYDVSSKASHEADRFLPDFVVAWMLLQRSGLDSSEKASIIASLKNRFTTDRVKTALRLNWNDEDLKRRDQQHGHSLFTEDFDYADLHEEFGEDMPEGLDEDEQKEYAHLTAEAEAAYQAMQGHRRTLREARERQTQMRRNRSFYPMKKDYGSKAADSREGTCFKCGGKHATAACPQRSGGDSRPSGSAHLTFFLEPEATDFHLESEAQVDDTGSVLRVQEILESGKAIIDGGATASVGSVDAMNRILTLNREKGRHHPVEVDCSQAANFRFGNNGTTSCLSTAQLEVPLENQVGHMKINVHEIPNQPVLLGISSLRALGAVIDFAEDKCILKSVNPSRIIQLERATGGHQVFPLTEDVYRQSYERQRPFHSLDAE